MQVERDMGRLVKGATTFFCWDRHVYYQGHSKTVFQGDIRAGLFQQGPTSKLDRMIHVKFLECY